MKENTYVKMIPHKKVNSLDYLRGDKQIKEKLDQEETFREEE